MVGPNVLYGLNTKHLNSSFSLHMVHSIVWFLYNLHLKNIKKLQYIHLT